MFVNQQTDKEVQGTPYNDILLSIKENALIYSTAWADIQSIMLEKKPTQTNKLIKRSTLRFHLYNIQVKIVRAEIISVIDRDWEREGCKGARESFLL